MTVRTQIWFATLKVKVTAQLKSYVCIVYIVIIVVYLKVELIINGNKQEIMIIKELFEGSVGEYCVARNTFKCFLT